MKTVYQTDRSGNFVEAIEADASPLEPGVYLIPAGCVETPPPAIPAGKLARWNGSAWVLVNRPGATPAPPQPTPVAVFTAAIDAHVSAAAVAWSYNSAESLASYAASTIPGWAAEATAFIAWRDAVWTQALATMTAVQAGTEPMPETPAAFIAGLPPLIRPTS